jgi:acyl-CoA dehydrogenase
MIDLSHLAWPFFDESHREFAATLERWACKNLATWSDHSDVDQTCRSLVGALGHAGWLRSVVPARYGGSSPRIDLRKLCLAREILSWHDGLADFAFAMQGLGSGSISLFGSDALKAKYLPAVCAGDRIAGFALTEPGAGSDISALATTATPDGTDHVCIDGTKTWISNGGIADHYVVFARTGEAPGVKGLSAFVVDAHTPGLTIAERIQVIAPHPLATLRFRHCRLPVTQRLGAGGDGFKMAMATLDIFRATVGAAALGIARRALHEATDRAATRMLFGRSLGDLQMTQAALAESVAEVDAAALLVYRAAWSKDADAERITSESSIAKMFATEIGQKVVDRAVQIHGGNGVRVGSKAEALYREIRALRIYEGATEVQKVVIARELMKSRVTAPARQKVPA